MRCPHCGSEDTAQIDDQDQTFYILYACNVCLKNFYDIESERKYEVQE